MNVKNVYIHIYIYIHKKCIYITFFVGQAQATKTLDAI